MNERPTPHSLEDLIATLHAAQEDCARHEKKYNMLTDQFFRLYSQGLLDDDGLNFDFVDWAGAYKTLLSCQREYQNRIKSFSVTDQLSRLRNHALVS